MSRKGEIGKTIKNVLGFLTGDDDAGFVRELDQREGTNLAEELYGSTPVNPGRLREQLACRSCGTVHLDNCPPPPAASSPRPIAPPRAGEKCLWCNDAKTVIVSNGRGGWSREPCQKCSRGEG